MISGGAWQVHGVTMDDPGAFYKPSAGFLCRLLSRDWIFDLELGRNPLQIFFRDRFGAFMISGGAWQVHGVTMDDPGAFYKPSAGFLCRLLSRDWIFDLELGRNPLQIFFA